MIIRLAHMHLSSELSGFSRKTNSVRLKVLLLPSTPKFNLFAVNEGHRA
jgi:hypothetical protein